MVLEACQVENMLKGWNQYFEIKLQVSMQVDFGIQNIHKSLLNLEVISPGTKFNRKKEGLQSHLQSLLNKWCPSVLDAVWNMN